MGTRLDQFLIVISGALLLQFLIIFHKYLYCNSKYKVFKLYLYLTFTNMLTWSRSHASSLKGFNVSLNFARTLSNQHVHHVGQLKGYPTILHRLEPISSRFPEGTFLHFRKEALQGRFRTATQGRKRRCSQLKYCWKFCNPALETDFRFFLLRRPTSPLRLTPYKFVSEKTSGVVKRKFRHKSQLARSVLLILSIDSARHKSL